MRVTINVRTRTTDIDVSEEVDEYIGMRQKARPLIIEAANRALAALGEPAIKEDQ